MSLPLLVTLKHCYSKHSQVKAVLFLALTQVNVRCVEFPIFLLELALFHINVISYCLRCCPWISAILVLWFNHSSDNYIYNSMCYNSEATFDGKTSGFQPYHKHDNLMTMINHLLLVPYILYIIHFAGVGIICTKIRF